MEETMNGIDDSKGGEAEELDSIPGVPTNDFAAFRAHLQRQLVKEGSKIKLIDDKEARQTRKRHTLPRPTLAVSPPKVETL